MVRSLLYTLAAAGVATAHFELTWPPTAGFIDDIQGQEPCGGATVTVDSSSPEVQVDRFAVSAYSSHAAGSWYFRATTDTQAPYNWTTIVPVINTTGLGEWCLQDIRAPAEFAGQPGIFQLIDSSVHGSLYQCAPVNWVAGSNDTAGATCTNSTGFSATWTSESVDADAAPAAGGEEDHDHDHAGNDNNTTTTPAATTSSQGAAPIATAMGSVLGLGLLAAGLAL